MKKFIFAPTPAWSRIAFGAILSILFVSGVSHPAQIFAQSNVSGDIAGTVTDPAGKAVVGATVTVKSQATDATKVATTGPNGTYRVSLLTPGQYTITVSAPGFETTAATAAISIGQINTQDVQLAVGSSATTVEVTGTEVPLLHTENANISTTFDMQQVQTLPNPGNDLTFVAQTAPGVVMNTQGGYGNFSAFGLPATSNTFTVNGGYENDPFLNVNNSGATNLLLGNNDVSDVSVVSNAYSVEFGGLGGAQINETTRSGANKFHGNATYWWNGRIMNANSYFHKDVAPGTPITPRSFDNVNQWAAGVSGPILRDKSFFFFNYEGLRVVLPTSGITGIPTAAYQAATLGADGLCDDASSSLYVNGNGAECGFYKTMFGVYNGAKGASTAAPFPGDPLANQLNYSTGNFTHEYLLSGRVDQNLWSKDHIFGHFKVDKGLQATYTDPLDPIFNADSPQPQYEGQLNESHTFSPNLVNQFVFATIYYRAIFTNTNAAAANALAPFSLFFASTSVSTFQGLGGDDAFFPQGRNVTGYQFIDDLSWNRGKHTFKFGYSFRRDDVTDYGPSVLTTPEVVTLEGQPPDPTAVPPYAGDPPALSFNAGNVYEYVQQFPSRLSQPVALYTEGFYAQDQWKPLRNLSLNGGIRFEHNSNPICITNCYARLVGDVQSLNGSTADTPYNQLISTGQHKAFGSFQGIMIEPRVGFAYSPFGADSKTVIRGGFGMFADSFPAQIADSLLNNAPANVGFVIFGGAIDPSQPTSAAALAATSATAFRSAYAGGGSFKSISAATGGNFAQPSFYNPYHKIYYPSYEEWSFQVEQQLTKTAALSVAYIGNHGYKEPVVDPTVNAYGFFNLPATQPVADFNTITQVYSGASSNYNGMVASIVNRGKHLTLQLNYEYSHALDEVSNGGFNSFGTGAIVGPINPLNLASNYASADYDVRQNVTGSYVYTLPYYGGPHALTDGWEIAGTVFHNTGFPFSITDGTTAGGFSGQGFGGSLVADQLTTAVPHHCASIYKADGSGVPCYNSTQFGPAIGFTGSSRNAFYGPGYTDTDMSLLKSFHVPGLESGKFTVGAQFFNLFNHPNFAKPAADISSGTFGQVTGTVNPPTSILGSFLGGDASPRLIQFKGTLSF